MDIPWSQATPNVAPLVGFRRQAIQSEGKISFLVNMGSTTYMVEFLIVSALSPSNCILGTTCDLSMEVSDGSKIHVIYGDHKVAQEFKRGKDLSIDLYMKIVEILMEFKGISAWKPDHLGGITKEITEYKLGIPSTTKLVGVGGYPVGPALLPSLPVSDNEAYEALLAGLQMAQSLKIIHLLITGSFEAKEENMMKYLDLLQKVIAREPIEGTWMESLKEKNRSRGTLMRNFILDEQLPDDPQEARKLRAIVPRFVFIEDQFYRTMEERKDILQETHEGIRGSHIDINILVKKTMRYGYYLPKMKEDAENVVQTCSKCQIHINGNHLPMNLASVYASIHECTPLLHEYAVHRGKLGFRGNLYTSAKRFKPLLERAMVINKRGRKN
ncbi:hypothetical protein M9H77_36324 [Catharanthus roseus]|uniref:Uncharacterized protein n=1 Tax=Catharanthus roseus TaxID=4058 RepID=A0ACB9ZSG9_CATRO|nr:hypothetical protein M9H77_36324 [Catharanthus roseus]